jgi:hypothetical protein
MRQSLQKACGNPKFQLIQDLSSKGISNKRTLLLNMGLKVTVVSGFRIYP